MDSSPRPKLRPELKIPYDDLEKIERVVWAEANTEGVLGRDAIRSVILNRLASTRFGNTVDDVLNNEFEPIKKYNNVNKIPVPKDDLLRGMNELVDYIQLGEDATKGRTFFQNEEITEKRGTKFSGSDPLKIGRHTFYRGYEGQEPVTDTTFSHNIRVDYGEPYEMAQMARGGTFSRIKEEEQEERQSAAQSSVEDKRVKAEERSLDAAKVTATRRDLYEETDEIISTPQMLSDVKNKKDDKLPEMQGQAEADTSKLPDREEVAGNGINLMSLSHGGMATAGMMSPEGIVGYDPVSGNPIPIGSTASNVRDDIPAALSEGEYVLSADVVKWHGLRHIMDMIGEAKTGLMAMASVGQMRGLEDEKFVGTNGMDGELCPCGKEDCDNCYGMDGDNVKGAKGTSGDDVSVEYATVEVVTEDYPMKEDSEGVKAFPKESGQYTVGDEQVLMIFETPVSPYKA